MVDKLKLFKEISKNRQLIKILETLYQKDPSLDLGEYVEKVVRTMIVDGKKIAFQRYDLPAEFFSLIEKTNAYRIMYAKKHPYRPF